MLQRFYTPERNNIVMLGQGRPQAQGDHKSKGKVIASPATASSGKAVYSPRLWVLALHQGHLHPRLYYIRVNLRQSFVAERSRASGLLKHCWPTDSEICHGQNAAQGMHYFRDYSILSFWIPEV